MIHWLYLFFILAIIVFMVKRRDTTVICIIGILAIALISTYSIPKSIMAVFNSFIYAAKELMGTILIISVITAMSKVLMTTGINEYMVRPFKNMMKTPFLAYWVTGILMMIISWFFWPSPAVALIGAVLLPAAVKVGLPTKI